MRTPTTSQDAGAAEPSPRRPPGSPGWLAPLLLLLALGGFAAFWLARSRMAPPAGAAAVDAGEPDAGPEVAEPPLQESDARVRGLLADVSSDPLFAAWLEQADLVRRFVAAVQQVANGDSPRSSVPFLAPAGSFVAREPKRGPATIDPRSHARYDAAVGAFTSIDASKAAVAYRTLRPLLDRAWRELGPPGSSFDDVLARAIDRLVTVPVPAGEVEIVPRGALWAFRDEDLERRSAAEKHLLRLGPGNMRRVQVKLRELQGALGLPVPARP